MYGPFVAALAVALWAVSGTLAVQGVDPMQHAFTARVYRDEGIAFAVPPTGAPLVYPSGYGALNAVTAAVAPLDIVQTTHLQHVLWCVAAVFLVAGAAGAPAALSLPFLAAFPIYALYPDIFYPGTPKQVGPPLFAAVVLLPLVRGHGAAAVTAWGLLPPLAVALNPACAPYAAAAALVGLVVYAVRADKPLAALAFPCGTLVVASALVLGNDLFYLSYLRARPAAAPVAESPPAAEPEPSPPPFSFDNARRGVRGANPVGLSPPVSTTATAGFDRFDRWNERPAARAFVLGALGLTAVVLLREYRRGRAAPAADRTLRRVLLAAVLLWFAVKYGATFLGHGFSLKHPAAYFLNVYIRYLLVRCELLLAFACVAGAAALLLAGRRHLVLTGLCWLLPAACLLTGRDLAGPIVVPTNARFPVTDDDLRLVAWVDDHLPPEKGQIGLAALATRGGLNDQERHLHPLDAGHALVVRGRHHNYRFALPALEGAAGFADYRRRVADEFDAAWCLGRDLRYFYAGRDGREKNPGLAKAIDDGRLREVYRAGDAAVYEVTK